MDDLVGDARRVIDHDADDAITISSATLHRVSADRSTLTEGAPRLVHMDVRFETTERWTLHDYRENAAVAPLDGTPFTQHAILKWVGEVGTADCEAPTRDWRLLGIEFDVPRHLGRPTPRPPLPW